MLLSMLYRVIRYAISLLLPHDKPRQECTIDDVKAALAEKAMSAAETLNWQTSIVDLCKLLGFNPTLEARREMYEKAGGAAPYTGSPEQNIWLHGQVMEHLAKQGFCD